MTGAEIVIAIISILASFATCAQYATQVTEKIKQKRELARAVRQAERLGCSLRDSESTIGDELHNLRRLNGTIGLGHGMFWDSVVYSKDNSFDLGPSELSLTEAQGVINSLQSLLRPLALQGNFIFPPDFSTYQTMADRSRRLTLESLHQLTGQLVSAASSTISLNSRSSLASSSTAVSPQPLMLSRTQLNFHNICKNARLYRENYDEFEHLTVEVPNGNNREWTCKHCNIVVSKASLRLSPLSPDLIWITAAGMFKAHCAREPGRTDGWTCIWTGVSQECNMRFDSEKRLLQHMKKLHVELGTRGQNSIIHLPADLRYRSPDTCGFGAIIGGQVMQDSEGSSCFFVPGSAS